MLPRSPVQNQTNQFSSPSDEKFTVPTLYQPHVCASEKVESVDGKINRRKTANIKNGFADTQI